MKYNIFALLFILFAFSCGTKRQLYRQYIGEPEKIMMETFGEPVSIIEREEGKVYIFEKEEKLGSTEINQGKFTLDPMITPQVQKTERYYFVVKDGIIISVDFEEEYER